MTATAITPPTDEMIKSAVDGTELCIHTWKPSSSTEEVEALVLIYHGFLAHGKYPTVRYAAELLVSNNITVVAADMRGHGKSGGLQGYLPSRDIIIKDSIQVFDYCTEQYRSKKMFLLGSSMGGTIALTVAQEIVRRNRKLSGVVLLAPMLKLKVDMASQYVLTALSYIAPTLSLIPNSSTNGEKQQRDPAKRKECEDDEYSYKGSTIRIGSAATLVDLANTIQTQYGDVTVPFLMLVADEEYVVENDLSIYEQSPSTTDKEVKHYPALHGLLCEPQPLVDTIKNDILVWIQQRIFKTNNDREIMQVRSA